MGPGKFVVKCWMLHKPGTHNRGSTLLVLQVSVYILFLVVSTACRGHFSLLSLFFVIGNNVLQGDLKNMLQHGI